MMRPWFRRLREGFIVVLVILAWSASFSARATADLPALDIKDVCTAAILQAERLEAIPDRLLLAVAMAESGRWDKATKQSYAWPWTVTNGGAGSFFSTLEDALKRVGDLQAAGQRNIDVGCMQVNLRAHPQAFPDLVTAFDPVSNARYAARFLRQLHDETGDWSTAVAYYHSRTPQRGTAYRTRVYAKLEKLAPSAAAQAAAGRDPLLVAPLSDDDRAAARNVMRIWHWLREGQKSSLVAQANAAESNPGRVFGETALVRRAAVGGIAVGRLLSPDGSSLAAR